MKSTSSRLAAVAASSLLGLLCGCSSGPDGVTQTVLVGFKPGTVLTIEMSDLSRPLTDAERAELLKKIAADTDTSVVPPTGCLLIFFKGSLDKRYAYVANTGMWQFEQVFTDPQTRVNVTVMYGKEMNPFENRISPLYKIVRENSAKRLSTSSITGILEWANNSKVTVVRINDGPSETVYIYAPPRAGFVLFDARGRVAGEYSIERGAYVETPK